MIEKILGDGGWGGDRREEGSGCQLGIKESCLLAGRQLLNPIRFREPCRERHVEERVAGFNRGNNPIIYRKTMKNMGRV